MNNRLDVLTKLAVATVLSLCDYIIGSSFTQGGESRVVRKVVFSFLSIPQDLFIVEGDGCVSVVYLVTRSRSIFCLIKTEFIYEELNFFIILLCGFFELFLAEIWI